MTTMLTEVPENCRHCGNGPMVRCKQEGDVVHGGRGLCTRCYRALWRYGFDEFHVIRPYRRSAHVLEDLKDLFEWGEVKTIPEAAERLGMKVKTLEKVIERQKKRNASEELAPQGQS